MQGEMPGRILDDQLRRAIVGHVIVTPLADGDALIELVATVERLAQRHDAALASQPNAQLLADEARSSIATDQIEGADLRDCAADLLDHRFDTALILGERQKLAAVTHRD